MNRKLVVLILICTWSIGQNGYILGWGGFMVTIVLDYAKNTDEKV